ncbi:GntR family transcriptional regulator [Streptomyces sp. NEAU-Y11]|uniref:GntR family transcriptional regulator n=1 Tax=Streptomyces cucumeris TaxID=2962890 RepID=UPI0020C8AD5B|nr:GntR family transcriptional regulator [Streptomyces sp. NEAU-Y11]MCP9209536.1 GntR family transcriptional regulator [Streptomyces sp. NEAU-Y11]
MTSNRRPKYEQIADALREAIQSGMYEPGDRLPSESEVMVTHGVARMTARRALGELRSEGIADARKGAGVFVRTFPRRPLRRQTPRRLSREQWGSGRSVAAADIEDRALDVDQVTVSEEVAPERIGAILNLGGEAVCVRRRRFVLDGKPVLLAASYLPMSVVAGSVILRKDTGPGGIYARLAELGHGPARFREEVCSRMPVKAETTVLHIPTGTPVILIRRTAFTGEGRPVEVNEMTLDAASYVLEYDFDA